MFHATPLRDVFITFHQSLNFFIVAPQRRSVRPKFFTPRRNIATQFGLNSAQRRIITELFFDKSKQK
jgi:hypothetical protein